MNLPEILDPRKREGQTALLCGLVILVGLLCFFLGRFSVAHSSLASQGGAALVGESDASSESLVQNEAGVGGAIAGGVIASKSGTKYHFPWCAGAKSIKEENKVWFASTQEARAAGYEPASNCKGLE